MRIIGSASMQCNYQIFCVVSYLRPAHIQHVLIGNWETRRETCLQIGTHATETEQLRGSADQVSVCAIHDITAHIRSVDVHESVPGARLNQALARIIEKTGQGQSLIVAAAIYVP